MAPLSEQEMADLRQSGVDVVCYTHVIVNHDGEGHPNWHRRPDGAFDGPPEGDAGRALTLLAQLVRPYI